MYHLKTILYPTDETTASDGAWKLAQLLARDHGAELVVLHVIPAPVVAYSELEVSMQPQMSPEEDIATLKQTYVGELGLKVRHIVDQGDTSEVIVRQANDLHASMIIMGTHGRKGIGRFVLGSVAEHVVRQAKCPVITVKRDWLPEA